MSDVHLTDPGTAKEPGEGRSSRVQETKRIVEALKRLAPFRDASFLLGDFNDSLAPLAHLLMSGYNSCFGMLGHMPPPTMPSFTNRLPAGFVSNFVYDWIVTNDRARPISASSPRVYAGAISPSDHWPVHAVYEIVDQGD